LKIRSLYRQDRDIIVDRINKLCRGAEIQQDCKVDFNITLSTDEVLNHPALEPFIRSALGPVLPYKFDLGAEDFCEFSSIDNQNVARRPSTYIFLGSALEGSITTGTNTIYPYHSPLFRIDERCMMTGVRTWL
jgi:metal-dependent amidase/aminoacylase/carboxypeptidase family protein